MLVYFSGRVVLTYSLCLANVSVGKRKTTNLYHAHPKKEAFYGVHRVKKVSMLWRTNTTDNEKRLSSTPKFVDIPSDLRTEEEIRADLGLSSLLPDEIWSFIFSLLTPENLYYIAQVYNNV